MVINILEIYIFIFSGGDASLNLWRQSIKSDIFQDGQIAPEKNVMLFCQYNVIDYDNKYYCIFYVFTCNLSIVPYLSWLYNQNSKGIFF